MKIDFNNVETGSIISVNIFEHSNIASNAAKYALRALELQIKNQKNRASDPLIIKKYHNYPEASLFPRQFTDKTLSINSAVRSLLAILRLKSNETKEHSHRLCQLSLPIGKHLNLDEQELNNLKLLCLLHDIGKISVPEHILDKPDKLTPEEKRIMQRHVQYGYQICHLHTGLMPVANFILCHHERYDGLGYPQNLKGEEIPLLSRILTILDAYDAMTNDRIYHKALSAEEAKEEIIKNKGTQFDPLLAEIITHIMEGSER